MIPSGDLRAMLAKDEHILKLLELREVSDGWEYLVQCDYHFPKFVIGWTDGVRVRFPFKCGLEENARRAWKDMEAAHA